MKVVIATCFQSNEERVNSIANVFRKRGDELKLITTNFLHKTKKTRKDYPKGYDLVPTIKYKKNLSLRRMRSHEQFASDTFLLIREYKPDLIWIEAPCNSLISYAKKYKKKHKDVKIIIDMIDMWPESLPININKNSFPFNLWRNIRSKNIDCADAVVSECDLYKDILEKEYKGSINTIHWCRDSRAIHSQLDLPSDELSLCYIGSINNIIDIDKICDIIKSSNKDVVLHVIGVGESKDKLIQEAKKICRVIDYGETYDEKIKEEVFSQCHAGINIYKDNLYIGLTVKSIDYLQYGLPIINNIKGDTWNLIEENDIGVNVTDNFKLDADKLIELRKNSKKIFDVYENNFTKEVFDKKCIDVINEVLK